jgi:hypothetical protein
MSLSFEWASPVGPVVRFFSIASIAISDTIGLNYAMGRPMEENTNRTASEKRHRDAAHARACKQ